MFLLAARLAGIGVRLLRNSKTLAKPIAKISKPAKKLFKKFFVERQKFFRKRVKSYYNQALKELGIPHELKPKLIFADLPKGIHGFYHYSKHIVCISNKHRAISKIYPRFVKDMVRHELKHSQQALEIARAGLSKKLPYTHRLPLKVQKLAESKHALRNINPNRAKMLVDNTKAAKMVVKTTEPKYAKHKGLFKRKRAKYLKDQFEVEARYYGADFGVVKIFRDLFKRSITLV